MLTIKCRAQALALAVLAAAASPGCAPAQFDVLPAPSGDARALGLQALVPAQYQFTNGDRVRITVFGQTNLSGEFTLDQTGHIALPVLGPFKAKGSDTIGLAKAIAAALKDQKILKDPKVTAEAAAYAPVFVLGEVNRPGEFAYRPGLSLFSAVALAGGFTFRADQNAAYIRRNPEGLETEYLIRSDIAVLPGDVVRIPEIQF